MREDVCGSGDIGRRDLARMTPSSANAGTVLANFRRRPMPMLSRVRPLFCKLGLCGSVWRRSRPGPAPPSGEGSQPVSRCGLARSITVQTAGTDEAGSRGELGPCALPLCACSLIRARPRCYQGHLRRGGSIGPRAAPAPARAEERPSDLSPRSSTCAQTSRQSSRPSTPGRRRAPMPTPPCASLRGRREAARQRRPSGALGSSAPERQEYRAAPAAPERRAQAVRDGSAIGTPAQSLHRICSSRHLHSHHKIDLCHTCGLGGVAGANTLGRGSCRCAPYGVGRRAPSQELVRAASRRIPPSVLCPWPILAGPNRPVSRATWAGQADGTLLSERNGGSLRSGLARQPSCGMPERTCRARGFLNAGPGGSSMGVGLARARVWDKRLLERHLA